MRSISFCTRRSTIGGKFCSSHSLSKGFISPTVISSSVRAPLPIKVVVIGGAAANRSISTVFASEDSADAALEAAGSETNVSADGGGADDVGAGGGGGGAAAAFGGSG